ncbi:MAG: AAA family ATPase [Bacteroidota bacterium]
MIEDQSYSTLEFLETKEYLRFQEFCTACLRDRYIGLCYGIPGVGKTISAKQFCNWDLLQEMDQESTIEERKLEIGKKIITSRSVFYTAPVMNSPNRVNEDLERELFLQRSIIGETCRLFSQRELEVSQRCGLIIIDEADRLNMKSLEGVRDMYDRSGISIILIGMPGLERKFSRYPQLYSRIGFAHEYRPIGKDEMFFILEHHWKKIGLELKQDSFADTEAVAAVIRATNGNFRLIHRLFSQIQRIMKINELMSITAEVVDAARSCLVIGSF